MRVKRRDRFLRCFGLWLLLTGIAVMFGHVPALDAIGAMAAVLGLGLALGVGDQG